jgi:hypothetical protein
VREVLAQQPVGLVRAALPGSLGVAEVDPDAGVDGEALVLGHLQTAVPGQRPLDLLGQLLGLRGRRRETQSVVLVSSSRPGSRSACREADATIVVLRGNDYFGKESEPMPVGWRLLYVVLTRARTKTIVLTWARLFPRSSTPSRSCQPRAEHRLRRHQQPQRPVQSAYPPLMGYGDQMGDLHQIEESARKLNEWISGDKGVFPPHSLIEAISPELIAIRTQLETYLEQLADRTPQGDRARQSAEQLVTPYEPVEVMALDHREGLFVRVEPPYRFRQDRTEVDRPFEPSAGGEISVAVYIDSDDDKKTERLVRSKAKAQQLLASDELKSRLVKVERALELAGLDLKQAQVDQGEAEAVARLLGEIRDVPRVCIRAGSVLLAKFTTNQGPVVVVRTLSQLEIRALERFPEIQKNPERMLEALATAVDSLETSPPETAEQT